MNYRSQRTLIGLLAVAFVSVRTVIATADGLFTKVEDRETYINGHFKADDALSDPAPSNKGSNK